MNAADPRQVKKARQKERLAHARALDDLACVLQTKEGRRFVWRQLEEAGVFRISFAPGAPDTTAFNEGRRNLGLALMAAIHELDPAFYLTMAQEAAAEAKTHAEPANNPDTEESE